MKPFILKGDDLKVDVHNNIPKGKDTRPDAVAVIIGNKRYSHGPDVAYAHHDAVYMKKYVIDVFGYKKENFIYELDATKGIMEDTFGTSEDFKGKLYNWVKARPLEVFVYYVGHGAPEADGKSAFLMPVDAKAASISKMGYSLDIFYKNLAKIPAKRITVVLDACFSGDSDGGKLRKNISLGMLKAADPVGTVPNAVIFAAAGKGQVSHWFPEKSHSLFTYFFMKGLKGKADSNKDKRITVGELKKYMVDKVSYRASRLRGKQTPIVTGDDSWVIVRLK